MNLPNPRRLIKDLDLKFSFVLIGDDAFPLKPNILKPYPGQNILLKERITNYRISRARRIAENAFGFATSRFMVYTRPFCANVDTATLVTKAVVALHNFLMKHCNLEGSNNYCPKDFVD